MTRKSIVNLFKEDSPVSNTGIIVQKTSVGYTVKSREKNINAVDTTNQSLPIGTKVILSRINGVTYITGKANSVSSNVTEVNVDG